MCVCCVFDRLGTVINAHNHGHNFDETIVNQKQADLLANGLIYGCFTNETKLRLRRNYRAYDTHNIALNMQ